MAFMEKTFAFTFNMDEGAQKWDGAAHGRIFLNKNKTCSCLSSFSNHLKEIKAKIQLLVAFVMMTLLIIWLLVVYELPEYRFSLLLLLLL